MFTVRLHVRHFQGPHFNMNALGQLSAFFSHAKVAKNGGLAVVIFGEPGN